MAGEQTNVGPANAKKVSIYILTGTQSFKIYTGTRTALTAFLSFLVKECPVMSAADAVRETEPDCQVQLSARQMLGHSQEVRPKFFAVSERVVGPKTSAF